ncbi:DEAD/DEAH box helicase [Saccharolobus islandicus]|uniref:DNA or RNA helicases of superfamily II n=3 Tax=Saccharolobus islandicus TaxID=43080 RepID=M9UEC5_SACIS|nr:DEAD/DEAH box helicase [Sulfolobus islandicus]ADX82560.1 nucleotide excision repair helicase, Xpb1 [Sulfolobus islandicus HVE10/4]ADX85196.1 nucleotide excision repair helicase, Xpb1 [Sulfolobus islandicus REY15A]AGJ62575.1 DNA or RNA helicases of superfamily II [Sulfolobus islandicus LAL14/1]WCM36161.1 DEAD/DEAH box helicase [Sulfolobus islandicus]
MSLRTFYIKQWLDEDDFKRLLLFSRYLGRDSNGSQFVIDLERAKRNGVKPSEIMEILEDYDVKLSQEDVARLKEKLLDCSFEIEAGKIIMKPYTYLADVLEKINERNENGEYKFKIKYDKQNRRFIIRPMDYYNLLQKLRENGLEVKELNLSFKEFEFEFNGQLREYQREAIENWIKNGNRGVIALPTGAGKTVVGIKGIDVIRKPTLIVTFTKEQMLQWKEAILKFTSKRPDIGFYYSEEKRIRPITITTYHTAYRHLPQLFDKFYLLIVDEVHHLPADKFKAIAEGLIAPYRMGLSATPHREDNKHNELFSLIGGIVYYKSVTELAKLGYLASYEIIQKKVRLTLEERKRYNELLNKFKALSKGRKVSELIELVKKGDESAIEAMRVYNEMRKIVNFASEKMRALDEILKSEKGKILIFTQYVDQAEEIARRYNCLLLTGKMSKEERKRVLATFKSMSAGILVLTTVGDEGIDIPDANVGIIVTGTSSRRQFIQRLGRIMRPYNGKQAKLYEIVVSGTPEEYQAKKRKETDILTFEGIPYQSSENFDKDQDKLSPLDR